MLMGFPSVQIIIPQSKGSGNPDSFSSTAPFLPHVTEGAPTPWARPGHMIWLSQSKRFTVLALVIGLRMNM